MTRATLLHVLDRPTALGPAEVRELEQLAQAFPYCQTAHLLLAKAAHDQGTMLAGQRLRRAATYAADRELLRRLIEQVEPAAVEIAAPTEPAISAEAVAHVALITAVEASNEPPATPQITAVATWPAVEPAAEQSAVAVEAPAGPAATASGPAPEPAAIAPAPERLPEPTAASEEPLPAAVSAAQPEAEVVEPKPEETAVEIAVAEEALAPALIEQEGAAIPTAEIPTEILSADPPAIEEALPAQAPAIRPPVEVGEARFEFGLAETPAPALPTYELPGLIDEWAAAATTLSLGSREPLTEALPLAPVTPELTPAAFTGDATIGYAFGESSRLGFSMQLLDLLGAQAEATECAASLAGAAQPPAAPLPPAGAFFEPDPLLLDHWATHCPPVPALPSLDLINSFLRRQPRLTRPAMLPPTTGAQTDLSVRSTQAKPELVSESLARILVRQGKTARAIEVYEQLMVKQPEKMAYFTAQIQQLQPPA